MRNLIYIVLVLLYSCNSSTTTSTQPYEFSSEVKPIKQAAYTSEWRELTNDELVKIGQVITANNIKGCGTMYIKSDADNYLVSCYSDVQKKWAYYEIEFEDGIGQLTKPKETSKQYITQPTIK